jgi:hypothetical protein
MAPSAGLLKPLPPMTIQLLKDGESMSYNYQYYKSRAKTCEASYDALIDWHKKAAEAYPVEAAVVK